MKILNQFKQIIVYFQLSQLMMNLKDIVGKAIKTSIYSKLYFFILALLPFTNIDSQSVLLNSEIQRGVSSNCQKFMIHYENDNMYVGVENDPFRPSFSIGDTSVYAYREDHPGIQYNLTNLYLLKFDIDQRLIGSFIINNSENVTDFYSTRDHNFISMTILKDWGQIDSLLPIALEG